MGVFSPSPSRISLSQIKRPELYTFWRLMVRVNASPRRCIAVLGGSLERVFPRTDVFWRTCSEVKCLSGRSTVRPESGKSQTATEGALRGGGTGKECIDG